MASSARRTASSHAAMFLWVAITALILTVLDHVCTAQVTVEVDARQVIHTMAGGIGASWHAMRWEQTFDPQKTYRWDARRECPQGSAVAGNPPLSYEQAWQDIYKLATWMRMDWLRVEVSRRMFEPARAQYDWDNDEMRTLYKILDWCQANEADVFLTEMWRNVDWLAYPDVHPLISAPRDLEPYSEGLAELVEHLVRRKHYTCIRWLCIANEPPGGTWGYWWSRGPDHPPLTPALRAVRSALDQRGLRIPLCAPDWTNLPVLDPDKLDFADLVGAFDIHSYGPLDDRGQAILADWARFAHARNRPFFLTELGDMSLGWREAHPGPATFAAALSNADKILRGLNVGVDAFNRWSFINRGDLDGQFQLVRTWNRDRKAYTPRVTPEPVAYYGYAILTRFVSKYSDVLRCTFASEHPDTLQAVALRSPTGQVTLVVAHRGSEPVTLRWDVRGLDKDVGLQHFQVTEARLQSPDYRMRPDRITRLSPSQVSLTDTVPAHSITVFTSVAHDIPNEGDNKHESCK